MPAVVHCPSCSGPLRVADDLAGRKVRCPSCGTAFDAPAAPPEDWQQLNLDVPGQPAAPPVETVPVDPWRVMNLSLDDHPEPPKPPPPEVPTAPRREERRRARLNDDHDDMRSCPACRKLIHRDARRCSWCGERFDEDGPRREVDRRARRDSEPHRGGAVLLMGVLSVITPVLACFIVPAIAGVILGAIAWGMGGTDLAKMRRGTMDPEGESNTRGGYICGIIGVVLNVLVGLSCLTFLGIGMANDPAFNRPPRRVAPPAPMPVPPVPVPPPAPGQ